MPRTDAMPGLRRSLASEVARSLGAEPDILPFLPALLEDLSELGGSVRHVLHAIKVLGLPPGSHALDLGCGKGVLAVRLAEQFDFNVMGVDAFAPFVEEARRRAAENGASEHCRFHCEDLRDAIREPTEFDLALAIALGPIEDSVGAARKCVRPGGYLIIDGGLRPETAIQLTARGDTLVQEIVPPADEIASMRLLNARSIRRKVELLSLKLPRRAPAFRRYLEAREKEALDASGSTYALWVLRRR